MKNIYKKALEKMVQLEMYEGVEESFRNSEKGNVDEKKQFKDGTAQTSVFGLVFYEFY